MIKKKRFMIYIRFLRRKVHSSKRIKQDLIKILFLICLSAFLISAFMIGNRLYSLNKENGEFEKIRQSNLKQDISYPPDAYSASPSMPSKPTSIPYTVITENSSHLNENGILKIYEKNTAVNTDMVGWINMPGYEKAIDYPVMQAKDNLFYLYRDFYKNKSFCGSIFMDVGNHTDIVDRNIILYGHAMLEMSMFGNLMDFPDNEDEYLNNTKIYLDLLNTQLEYEIFSTYYADATYNYRQIEFTSDEDYLVFLNRIRSKSFYDYKIDPSAQDKILTLSTCNNYSGKNDRIVIHARLIRQTLFTGTTDPASIHDPNLPADKEVISANMYLNKLDLQYSLSEHEMIFEKIELDPVFKVDTRKYKVSLPSQTAMCKLSIDAEDPKVQIDITLDDQKVNPDSIIIQGGNHTINIKVTSQDKKYSRTYSILVTKE